MAIFFKILSQKYTNKAFWVPNLSYTFFFSHEILQLDKFEGADFKYNNTFLKIVPENAQLRDIWSQILAFSLFHKILQLEKFNCPDFKHDNSFLKRL